MFFYFGGKLVRNTVGFFVYPGNKAEHIPGDASLVALTDRLLQARQKIFDSALIKA